MKFIISIILYFALNLLHAAPPIEGWYSSIFGGYAFVPNYIDTTHGGALRNHVNNQSGFDVGGNLGFKSTTMRYEIEGSYLKANVNSFNLNNVNQSQPSGYNLAVLGMANAFYDLPGIVEPIKPFLGFGIGYAWVQAVINSEGPSTVSRFSAANSAFAYQGYAGLTYNFAENYALTLAYRYVATTNLPQLGNMFQVHMLNAGAIYRFDGENYK